MRPSKRKFNNRSDGVNFEKRFEQFFETGRQIADGFSGARPGSRKRASFSDLSRRNVRNVSNWVTDKMDSFFEDDYEDWSDDNVIADEKELKSFERNSYSEENFSLQGKRPLEAISLRLKDESFEEQKILGPSKDYSNQDWEENSFFQTSKWQRPVHKKEDYSSDQKSNKKRISTARNFPRSRRSRL